MNMLNRIITAILMLVCIAWTGQVLADSVHDRQLKNNNYDVGQFKFDMIMAKRGDADAQYRVGSAYEEGRGTQKNLKLASEWYAKAAKQGQLDAEYQLAYFYENGIGVSRNSQLATVWYERAAKGGYRAAQQHLHQEAARKQAMRNRYLAAKQAKEKRLEQQRKLAEERARREAVRKQHQREMAASGKGVTHRVTSVARVNIPNISDVILHNKWNIGPEPADYLPSSSTHCLKSSDTEIICFSDQKQRIINGMRVVYTTKSTLSGFKTNGTFQVKYNYNAIQMDKATTQGSSTDPNGLKLQQGWQQPPLAMNCRTTDGDNIYCARGYIKLQYHHS